MAMMKPVPGFGTEYTDNYKWGKENSHAGSWNKEASGLFGATSTQMATGAPCETVRKPPTYVEAMTMMEPSMQRPYIDIQGGQNSQGHPHRDAQQPAGVQNMPPMPADTSLMEATGQRNPNAFLSQKYPSVYRECVVRKDDRGKYIDPFGPPMNYIANKPYGRRLIYDDTHPDKMYASQWSSELADAPGPYSYPTTTELPQEIPWTKDLQWQAEGEVGNWPTDLWKTWERIAECPPYHGHDDQVEYSQYKVQVP